MCVLLLHYSFLWQTDTHSLVLLQLTHWVLELLLYMDKGVEASICLDTILVYPKQRASKQTRHIRWNLCRHYYHHEEQQQIYFFFVPATFCNLAYIHMCILIITLFRKTKKNIQINKRNLLTKQFLRRLYSQSMRMLRFCWVCLLSLAGAKSLQQEQIKDADWVSFV